MPASQPNILFLFTDQQRYDTIAALGNSIIKTPALDRLAGEGTAFTQAYTPSPVCMAARCAIVTGQPPHVTGCTANNPMPQDRPSFMQHLNQSGYQTAGIGKMHFSPDPHKMWGYEQRIFSEEGASPDDEFVAYLREQGSITCRIRTAYAVNTTIFPSRRNCGQSIITPTGSQTSPSTF